MQAFKPKPKAEPDREERRRRRCQRIEAMLLIAAPFLVLVFVWPGALLKKPIHAFICASDPAISICSPALREN